MSEPKDTPKYLPFLFDCFDCEKTFTLTDEGCGGSIKKDDRVQGFLCHSCMNVRVPNGDQGGHS